MTFKTILAALGLTAAATVLAACSTIGDIPTDRVASARVTLSNGIPVGTAQLLADGNGLQLSIVATGLTPGAHGFHLHETGECRRPDFTSAGGHLNPLGNDHGTLSDGGSHLGDLPNLDVNENGTATLTVELDGDRAQLEEWLFDDDGTAVVIHAGADDYRTNPSGAAGSRVACGVLERV
ncbi:superoxide dismutase family protein [Erythrobacter sp. HKB08]|uniref:superoxide dismutase family protein n=1 Tax=Erythrobacter sp. HKB08 TaxID=2502843 RepID=UPI0010088DA0|nr:superoxide dismutase family protein [Erythrobacter sp. HKB08]